MADAIKIVEAEPVKTAEEKKPLEKTVGEVINDVSDGDKKPASDKKPEPETVPLSALLDYKKENKELRKDIDSLRQLIEEGTSKKEISKNIQDLADKFDVDPAFMSEFRKTILAEVAEETKKKAEDKEEPREEKPSKKEPSESRAKLIEEAFSKEYTKAMERLPEYVDIANEEAIKALSFLPQNANKTFVQLIEETYGKAVPGKRTIDSITPGGGKEPAPLDYAKAQRDTEYFKEVMANPTLKAEYNKRMLEPNRRH